MKTELNGGCDDEETDVESNTSGTGNTTMAGNMLPGL